MRFGVIIPNLPELVLRRVFDLLTYKDLCVAEQVCRRWRMLIFKLCKRDIEELTVEQSSTYSNITVSLQIPFKRLTVCCTYDAVDFLSGVLRRSRMSVVKLSCDLRFLANMDKLNCDREGKRKYWSNVEDLWLIVTQLNDEITEKFLSIDALLFLNLKQMTIQIHERASQAVNIGRIISAITLRFPKIQINMELHAISGHEICAQLSAFSSMELKKLKLICLNYDPSRLSLSHVARLCKQNNITLHNLTLRDWTIKCEPHEAIFHNAVETFRLSSCGVENVDHFASALRATFAFGSTLSVERATASRKANPIGRRITNLFTEKTNVPPFSRYASIDLIDNREEKRATSEKSEKPFVERLEVAGQCVFHGLGYLNEKAHVEFEYRVKCCAPLLDIDCSDIYYYD